MKMGTTDHDSDRDYHRRHDRERKREGKERREREKEIKREGKERRERKDIVKSKAREGRESERERARKRRETEREEDVRYPNRKRQHKDRLQCQDDQEEERRRKKKRTCRDDLEGAQQKPKEEMDKRRHRVLEWQELRRKEEQQEREREGSLEEHPETKKAWTLEGESDDKVAMDDTDIRMNDGEIDPLDVYMCSLIGEVEKSANTQKRIIPCEDSDSDYEDLEDDDKDQDDEELTLKKTKTEKLSIIDHSTVDYPHFRKNFYIELKEISTMTADDVAAYRKEVQLKIHGKDVPKPVKRWTQTGLTTKILDTIKKMGFEKPMPIQAQAFPIIMSGRDCIGIAKTGSGKTLAFVLPMLRHIKDQPLVARGDGPVGLILAPTRELVKQICSDITKFSKVIGIRCVPVYGGSDFQKQISDLKRGTEIVVCTPGRMIDVLCGKIVNLRRVTFLVMDEADRMFDMGFEPQITKIVQNIRPDRQTVLFSATFPRQVEILARKVLNKPVEIQVGGRSVVNKDIIQLVEVRPESDRMPRLLQLLGEWSEKGKILVFVQSQDKCDSLFRDLILKYGYRGCLSLHGGKDQSDRESTITDFKSNSGNILVATSIASRGLDVKELELVVNFDVPNHYEDYVHRVGRTGRAGKKGYAVTFISEDEARYAPDLVKALELSEQAVPEDLKALADVFMVKVNQGKEQAHGTGYGGTGFKFDEAEDDAMKAAKKAQARQYGFEEERSDSDSDDNGVQKFECNLAQATTVGQDILKMNLLHKLEKIQAAAFPEYYAAELEINDFPQNARMRVTHRDTLGPISDRTGATITIRGQYYPPGKLLGQGDRKLYLFLEGPTESSVMNAKAEVKRVLGDFSTHSLSHLGAAAIGKYFVV